MGGDMLTVQEVDRLGRNLLEGLIVLNDPFQRGVAVKVLEGIAAGVRADAQLRRACRRQNSLPSGSARQCQDSSPVWPMSAGRAPSFRRRSSSAS
jgi:hypothetical protein